MQSKTSKRLAHLGRRSARRVPSFHADSDAYPGTLTAEASRMQVTEVTKHVKACCADPGISRRPVTWLLLGIWPRPFFLVSMCSSI